MKTSKKDFIAEAEDIIETINSSLLNLQNSFSPDMLNSVFRAVHTLKGLSGLFGLKGISNLSHTLESVLDDLRLDKIEFSDDTLDFLFHNMDILKTLILQVSEDKVIDIDDVTETINAIEKFREASKSKSKEIALEDTVISPDILKVLSEYEEHRLSNNIKQGNGLYLAKVVFELTDFAPGLETLNANLKELGEVIATLPSSEGIPEGSIGFNLLFGSFSEIKEIKSKAAPAEVELIIPVKKKESQGAAADIKPMAPESTLKSSTNMVRVDIGKLDKILNTVGELVLAKGAIVRIGSELAENTGYTPLTIDVHKISQTLERKLSELQMYILELRMVPFSQIFTRLAQVVRRHTRETGKEIDLQLFGEDTEIDKLLAEGLIDPLIHIIRNAIDHGIELTDKREALGKNKLGTVTLKAFSKGNNVVVMIQDDGAGLDTDKIFKKAVDSKLITGQEDLNHKEKMELIFIPGLSTKEEISEVSGRGVGMDIVKESITSMGGFVEVDSEKGSGTTFHITLPITLAIIKSLIANVSGERFAIPISSISETFIIHTKDIQTIEGREVVELRGEMLPMLRIARVFLLEETPFDEYFVIIIGFGGKRIGLLVDNLSEQTEVVVKPLGKHLKNIKGLAGAAEIGRHEIILVLDVEDMIEEAFFRKKQL